MNSSKIRQLENAINLLIEGVLRETDDEDTLGACVLVCLRTGNDWAEDLTSEPESIFVAFNGPRRPSVIEAAIQTLVMEYDDLMGNADEMLKRIHFE